MYSQNLLDEEFRDEFLRYNDIFAIHTKYVCVHGVCDKKMETVYLKSGRNARFEEIPRVLVEKERKKL